MALIKSISGIRGTIGGKPGEGLTPIDLVTLTAAYAQYLKEEGQTLSVVVGRDGRISGKMVQGLVVSTLQACGVNVIDCGLSTTPTVEMLVPAEEAGGGIILTASHNPKEWNALKLLNSRGEFLDGKAGERILQIAEEGRYIFEPIDKVGLHIKNKNGIHYHINKILEYPLVNIEAIKKQNYTVVVDAVNSTGSLSLPPLLEALGVAKVIVINEQITGDFAHNPEPLEQHLTELSAKVVENSAALGVAVDPDVDRLAFIGEDGSYLGEEYTLVMIADYMLQHRKGAVVSNMSSTRALQDVAERYGCKRVASKVGEVNVVEAMKKHNAVLGGEGNGGVIIPDLHYGRDALAGVALMLSYMATSGKSAKAIRNEQPDYFMAKMKIDLPNLKDADALLQRAGERYKQEKLTLEDGVKVDYSDRWLHLRKSNTEPIVRVYAEAPVHAEAEELAEKAIADLSA